MQKQVQVKSLFLIFPVQLISILVKSSTATSGSPPPNSYTQRYQQPQQQRRRSPSPTVNLFSTNIFVFIPFCF
jgi:hypothetical protein